MKNTKPNISKQISIDTVNDACDKNYQVIMLNITNYNLDGFTMLTILLRI